MAPEIIENVGYDNRVDIWSLGIFLYELLHGFSPFRGDNPNVVFKNIKSGQIQFGSHIGPEARDLIQAILKREPKQRISIEGVLAHSLFKKYSTLPDKQESKAPIVSQTVILDDPFARNLSIQKIKSTAEETPKQNDSVPKDPSILPPKSQSKIYSLIQKKYQSGDQPQSLNARQKSVREESADGRQGQFDSFLTMQKKEILGTNNPLKKYLNKQGSFYEGSKAENEADTSMNLQSNRIHRQDSSNGPMGPKINPNPLKSALSLNHQNGSYSGLPSGSNTPGHFSRGMNFIDKQPNRAAIKETLANRVVGYGISPKLQYTNQNYSSSQQQPANRSLINQSQNRSNRSIFENEDMPALRDTTLERPRPAEQGERIPSARTRFEDLLKAGESAIKGQSNQVHVEVKKSMTPSASGYGIQNYSSVANYSSNAANQSSAAYGFRSNNLPRSPSPMVHRDRDESRDRLGTDQRVYKPLLHNRYQRTPLDDSQGRIELSVGRIGREKLDTSGVARGRDDSIDIKHHYTSNNDAKYTPNTPANRSYRAQEHDSSLLRARRAEIPSSGYQFHRSNTSATQINKENSHYYSNFDAKVLGGPTNSSYIEAQKEHSPSPAHYISSNNGLKQASGSIHDHLSRGVNSFKQFTSRPQDQTSFTRTRSFHLFQH